MPDYQIVLVHKDTIKKFDTIERNGETHTVCGGDLKWNNFTGVTIFGDSYRLGYQLVAKVIFPRHYRIPYVA